MANKIKLSAAIMASLSLSMLLCSSCLIFPDPRGNLPEEGGDKPASGFAFVATTDYSLSGGFGVVDLDSLSTYIPDAVEASRIVSPDPVVRVHGDYIFVINRFGNDNITVLDREYGVVNQYAIPGCEFYGIEYPANPHDLAFVSDDKAYLTRYGCKDLWILNPVTGERLDSIDLYDEGYQDADERPEMSGMLLHGESLYVAVQLLDRFAPGEKWPPAGESFLVVIDTATDRVVADVLLTGTNPVTDVEYSAELDRILVGCAGKYYESEDGGGGIESIDPATAMSEGFVIDEETMGGDIGDFAVASAERAYATIGDLDFRSTLIAFNPSTGTVLNDNVYTSAAGFVLWDIALASNGRLLVCDRNATDPGLVVIDINDSDALLTPGGPIYLGLPPFSIALVEEAP